MKTQEIARELAAALERYGSHEDHCPKSIEQIMIVGIHGKPPEFCTCGFEAALAKYYAAGRERKGRSNV